MQSSFESCSASPRRDRLFDDELEDGEIEDEDDEQLESHDFTAFNATNRSSYSANLSSAIPATSTVSLTASQLDRFAGGFWAKLKKNIDAGANKSHQSHSTVPSEKEYGSSRSVAIIGNSRKNYLLVTSEFRAASDYVPIDDDASDARHCRLDIANCSGRKIGNADGGKGEKQRLVDDENNILSEGAFPEADGWADQRNSSDQNQHRITGSFEADEQDGDDEELLELQLRLAALQSTMRRSRDNDESAADVGTLSKSGELQSQNRNRSSKLRGRDKCKDSSRPIAPVRPIGGDRAKRDGHRRQRASESHKDGRLRSRDISKIATAGAKRINCHHAQNPAKRDKSAEIATVHSDELRSSPVQQEGLRWHHERERILSIPDPKEQFLAFLQLLLKPRSETPSGHENNRIVTEKYLEDNLEISNMEMSSDSEGVGTPPASTIGGCWRRPCSSTEIPSAKVAMTCPVLREVDNTRVALGSAAVSALEADANDAAAAPNHVAADEEYDEEEMEALRELALTSMLKAKAKKRGKSHSPVHEDPREKEASSSIKKVMAENHPPKCASSASIADICTDGEETEVVITLNKDILKKSVELARRRIRCDAGSSMAAAKRSESSNAAAGAAASRPKEVQSQTIRVTVENTGTRYNSPKLQQVPAIGSMQKGRSGVDVGLSKPDRTMQMMRMPSAPVIGQLPLRVSKQRPLSPTSRTKLAQLAKVVHKPLVIPLESDSSDTEDEHTAHTTTTTSVNDRSKRRDANHRQNSKVANSGSSTNMLLVKQLEDRLRVCVDDLAKHQNCLNEDQKRLRTLESIVRRYKTDLRLAEMRMQKLKKELVLVEAKSSSYRVSIGKFNTEIQKVQSRVDKNFGLQRLYLRQWKQIEQLVSKHKLDLMNKMPQSDLVRTGLTMTELPAKRKPPLNTSNKVASAKKKAKTVTSTKLKDGKPTNGTKTSNKSSTGEAVDRSSGEIDQCRDSNPLRWFRSFRLSPWYRNVGWYKFDSITFSNKLNPFVPLCPFALAGECLDPKCIWQHEKEYRFTDVELIADLLSYRPDVIAEGADKKAAMAFAEQLYNSLRSSFSLNEILAYCLSQMKSHAITSNNPELGVTTEARNWTMQQSSDVRSQTAVELTTAITADVDTSETEGKVRYFSICPRVDDSGKESPPDERVGESQQRQ